MVLALECRMHLQKSFNSYGELFTVIGADWWICGLSASLNCSQELFFCSHKSREDKVLYMTLAPRRPSPWKLSHSRGALIEGNETLLSYGRIPGDGVLFSLGAWGYELHNADWSQFDQMDRVSSFSFSISNKIPTSKGPVRWTKISVHAHPLLDVRMTSSLTASSKQDLRARIDANSASSASSPRQKLSRSA